MARTTFVVPDYLLTKTNYGEQKNAPKWGLKSFQNNRQKGNYSTIL